MNLFFFLLIDFWHEILGYEQHVYQANSQDEKKAQLFMFNPKLKWIAAEIFTCAVFLQVTEKSEATYPFLTLAFLLLSFSSDWLITTFNLSRSKHTGPTRT